MALPLALRCAEAVVVDPSEGMREQFDSIRAEAGIQNARYIQEDWLTGEPIRGDLALVCHVTYFVPAIERFVGRLVEAARRRVTIVVNSTPPPNQVADLFELLHGTPQSLVPGHQALLPVLWEMGFLPEVRVLPVMPPGAAPLFRTREEAVESLTFAPQLIGADVEMIRRTASEHFDRLFAVTEGGWVRPSTATTRAVLITWETR